MRKKRRTKPHKDNNDRWLLTYSDLITLLMIYFIVMFAISNTDLQKFAAIADGLSRVLGGGSRSILMGSGPSVESGLPIPPIDSIDGGGLQNESKQMLELEKQLQDYIDSNSLKKKISVNMEERGIVVSFYDPVLFPLGSAELTPASKDIIKEVAGILIQSDNYIRIEGHTDDIPINTGRYPSNWELSAARATSVVQELINTHNFPPVRLAATGYGEYRPRVPNDTMEHKQLNRRVDIVVLRSKYNEAEPMSWDTGDRVRE
ncbi:OmpA/MotB family protein [Desulfolucanica intricata]|uniref:OmpA/MotB family protein n=1 Tax=Desulfolucanica intricata TaxID=1285191 RepID=UPI0008306365|nr:flagellar motor protein MotB [Desulfolucanica intricata]